MIKKCSGKFAGCTDPLGIFSILTIKPFLILVFLKKKIMNNKVVAHVNVRNFCLKQIPRKSTLKKIFEKQKGLPF